MDLHHESARVCQFEEADVIFLQPDIRDEFGPGSVDPPSFVRFPQAQPAVPIPVVALQQEAEAPWLGQETCRSVQRSFGNNLTGANHFNKHRKLGTNCSNPLFDFLFLLAM